MVLLHDRRVRYVLAGGVSSGTYYGVFWIGWLVTAVQAYRVRAGKATEQALSRA